MDDVVNLGEDYRPIEFPTYDWGKNPSTDYYDHEWFWPLDKRVLTVSFVNGTNEEKNTIRDLVNEHYNTIKMGIRFKFLQDGDSAPPDIRVEMTNKCSSLDGCMATTALHHVPTMWLDMSLECPGGPIPKDFRQANILHEFGHALGLKHAHCHPDCKINWNFQSIQKKTGWTHQSIELQMRKLDGGIFGLMPYDQKSIMHYPIHKGDTHSMITTLKICHVLSKGDKKFLMAIYPPGGTDRTLKGVTERMLKPTSALLREGKKRRGLRSTTRQDLGHSDDREVFLNNPLIDNETEYLGNLFSDSKTESLGTVFLQTILPRGYRYEIVSIAFLYCMAMYLLYLVLFH
ncbi:hypothetical protein CEP54_011614 [Fusarium duplospermum]|uniref:Peptidase M12A domain-containing protein n=1 Tax=Fusarium duplospermum TaxID=1325734 RepID=A0A428PDE7_9HYPO|nr:hypothetical protein CEP54_011614 [Fusarium duplospermum]